MLPVISVTDLKKRLDTDEDIYILDVREPVEFAICQLPSSHLIPLGDIPRQVEQVPRDKPVVVICHHGFRSAQAIKFLQQHYQFLNLINLRGGIHAWAQQIDLDMPVY